MLCVIFGWNWPDYFGEDFLISSIHFRYFLIGKEQGPSFEQTWIQGCFVPSLVEITPGVLEKKIKMCKDYRQSQTDGQMMGNRWLEKLTWGAISCNERKSEQAHKTQPSNIAWECCIQRMAIPSISDGQSDRKPVSSYLHKIILAKVQKGYKLLLHEILSSGFSGVALRNCFE